MRGGRFIEVTPPVFLRTGRRGRSNLPITTGTRVCPDGFPWLDFRLCSVFRASVTRRQLVLCPRRSRVRHVLLPGLYLRCLRRPRPRPRLLHHLLRLFRIPPRVLIPRRIRLRRSPSRIRLPSAISRRARLIRLTVVPTATPRLSRPHVRSTSRELVTRRAVALLTAGVDVLLLVLGIVRVRRGPGSQLRWRPRMRWGADSRAC